MELEKENKNKKIIIGVIVALVVIALIVGAILLFGKKDSEPANNEQTVEATPEPTVVYEQELSIGSNSYQIKITNISKADDVKTSEIYLDNDKVAEYEYETIETKVIDKYIVFEWRGGQADLLVLGYVDEKGNYYDVTLNDIDVYDIHLDNGKLIGSIVDTEGEDWGTKEVEIKLNKEKIEVVK